MDQPVIEYVPLPEQGRQFVAQRLVRLSDADTGGSLRLDGVVRYLQDVATDDWDDSGLETGGNWVVRRTSVRQAEGGRWPLLSERLTMTTWCSGYGAAWAERRTNFAVDGQLLIEGVALWVPLDADGRPLRIPKSFLDYYGEASQGRKIPGRISIPEIPQGAQRRPWPLRKSDLDIVGHVNNATLWSAVGEVTPSPVLAASLIHHGPVEANHAVELIWIPGQLWLEVDGTVRVSAWYSC